MNTYVLPDIYDNFRNDDFYQLLNIKFPLIL
jgi:hypothetical protein